MKTQPVGHQSGNGISPHPLWMRLLIVFCVALLGVASTVQVCHSHDEAQFNLSVSAHSTAQAAYPESSDPPRTSAVNCPLCVAMHSALPVTHTLNQVAMLRAESPTAPAKTAPRLFLWRFEQASRPPPAASPFA